MNHKKIAIFASGSGTNAANIIRFFSRDNSALINAVFTNSPSAGVHQRAAESGVSCIDFTRDDFYKNGEVLRLLSSLNTDLVVLAGFLWLVPPDFIAAYHGRIVNIHPALLPAWGGKGMYGMHVHKAVIEAGETISGITIHLVNENYDEGDILFQATCPVLPNDTPDSLAARIHQLEYEHFPMVIKHLIERI